jgi:signal transduction histidine kinase
MVIQASAAETTIQTNAVDAATSLQAIQNTGRQALGELRGLLGVLRTDAGSAPQKSRGPRIDDLDALAESYSVAGLVVSIDRAVDVSDLGDAVELAVYRLVQESLTNALKHGGQGTASVVIKRTDDQVTVRIDNTVDESLSSPVAAPTGSGHGITGMRERVWSLGGSLTAAPTDGRGFQVSAVIPLTNGRA